MVAELGRQSLATTAVGIARAPETVTAAAQRTAAMAGRGDDFSSAVEAVATGLETEIDQFLRAVAA